MGIDDEDSDDFNIGTTGPTVTQTDINPDNSFSGSRKLASGIVVEGSWTDVQSKAQRIYKDGGVRIISVTGPYIAGNVKGSEGVYETTLQRGPSGSIDQWTCSCPWFAYSFGRSGRWKKYEGRMCSHALALQYKAQSEGMFGREIKEDTQSPGWDKEITHYTPPPPKEWRASFDPLLVADDSTDGAMVHTELPSESRNPYIAFSVEPPNVGNFFQGEFSAMAEDNASMFSGTPCLDHISHVVELGTCAEMRDEVDTDRTMARMTHLEAAGISNEVGVSPTMRPNGLAIDTEATISPLVSASGPVPTFIVASSVDVGPEAFFDSQIPSHTVEYSIYEAPPPKDWRASKLCRLPTPATKAYLRFFASTDDEPRASDGTWTKGMGDLQERHRLRQDHAG